MVAVCVPDILRDCDCISEENVGLVEKGRKKREKIVPNGAARDIRIFCGDVLDKKWGVERVRVCQWKWINVVPYYYY